MIVTEIKNLGQVTGSPTEVYRFSVTIDLRMDTIAEAKIRGLMDHVDLPTKITLSFHIVGSRLRGKNHNEVEREAKKEAEKLLRVALYGRLGPPVGDQPRPS
ncbi:hypothetical protein JET14_13445 [Martelella lutilitoris]|uniref:Uncharacterized protein n=1 Tax=Martelella lutilitoris TaxID=2583532 RepID=A0A7T7KK92_9HYPH|nr:hypothetical protein [Martelella lutilitoris]QQM29328.1 hypothetical protein JET14_13445 [Martelella lutilitoris]